jgi:arginine:agmatine antiporter
MKRGRKLGPLLATALVASNMIGSGIFLLPASLATVGSLTVIGWLIGASGALLIALVLAKLSSAIPLAGGPCAYATRAFGPYFGFQASAIYWTSCWTGNIAIAVAATGYLLNLLPQLHTPLMSALATVGLIWILTAVNVLGPRFVCQIESFAILMGLAPILIVATAGWWYFDGHVFMASWNMTHEPTIKAIPQSLVLLFWAFTGLESASIATAVVEDPARNVPIATVGGVLLAALVYIASCSVIMGLIPAEIMKDSSAPFADAVKLMFGPVAGALIAVAALIKSIGTLGGWILMTAQTGKAAADHALFPRVFARTDAQGVPVTNLIWMAVLMTAVVFATISATLGEQFGHLIEVSTILCLLMYIYACLALLRAPHWASGAAATAIAGYRPAAIVAAAFCAVVIAYSELSMLMLTATLIALSTLVYWLFGQRWQAPSRP